jgi:hypothetical protein
VSVLKLISREFLEIFRRPHNGLGINAILRTEYLPGSVFHKSVPDSQSPDLKIRETIIMEHFQHGRAEAALADVFLHGDDVRDFGGQPADQFLIQGFDKPAVDDRGLDVFV